MESPACIYLALMLQVEGFSQITPGAGTLNNIIWLRYSSFCLPCGPWERFVKCPLPNFNPWPVNSFKKAITMSRKHLLWTNKSGVLTILVKLKSKHDSSDHPLSVFVVINFFYFLLFQLLLTNHCIILLPQYVQIRSLWAIFVILIYDLC